MIHNYELTSPTSLRQGALSHIAVNYFNVHGPHRKKSNEKLIPMQLK